MKYIISILILCAIFQLETQAQTEKGNFMLGSSANLLGVYTGALPNQASIGFGKNKVGDNLETNYTNLNLSFNSGFFVANGLMLGLDIGGFHSKSTTTEKDNQGREISTQKEKWTNIAVTPVARYYLNQGNKLQFFGELRGGLALQKQNSDKSDLGTVIGAKAGGAYFVNPKIALDFFFDFNGIFQEVKTTNIFDSSIGLGLGFSIFL